MLQLPILNMPRAVPLQQERRPQENIPQTRREREEMRRGLRAFVFEKNLTPPLSMEELRTLTEEFITREGIDPKYLDYAGVILSGEVWREQLASVPYDRRLLLLPKCMRVEAHCPAPFDEFGLLCKQCGHCSIQDLQDEAERLGYAVLVAEGSALVMAIIETGKIDAIVGVSCLSVLEKAFPYMDSAAIPGIAIPLLQDDCKDVTVDLEWVWEVIHLHKDDRTYRIDLDTMRQDVQKWFDPESLRQIMGEPVSQTEQIAQASLAQDGKRWRPFLTACAWKAMNPAPDQPIPDDVRRLGIAVECFHKASLIHDDIEDNDDLRYGEPTVHIQHGTEVALNVGDLLIGEGYRLISECSSLALRMGELLRVASIGHRNLCLGQGEELTWTRNPRPLKSRDVLEIFRRKTAPAFDVALQLGAVAAGADEETLRIITQYSEALGIAYQIRDDLQDLDSGDEPDDIMAMRPTLPLAILYERTIAREDERAIVEKVWTRSASAEDLASVRRLLDEYDVRTRCRVLQESYKEEAIRALSQLEDASLKGLLRRVISKIFLIEIQGWCRESES